MSKQIVILCIALIAFTSSCYCDSSATEVIQDMYNSCLNEYSISCVKPKALAWISQSMVQDKIRITEDLSIIKTSEDIPNDIPNQQRDNEGRSEIFEKIESFLSTHALKIEVPQILKTEEARSLIPDSYLEGGLAQGLVLPLSEGNAIEGRGFVKKVMIPFLLGLKFKTSVLVPLALALIALKTWKAMTLGLLSIVLSGALVIFKLFKPKIVNYEVVHYPHHHHVEHHVDHPPPHHVEHGWEPQPGWARQFDAQNVAYSGQI